MIDATPPPRAVIDKLVLKNFRRFRDATIMFTPGLNMLVGDNEAGKSTLLEAINLALTSRWQNHYFSTSLTHHFINAQASADYVAAIGAGQNPELPEIVVELFLHESGETAALKGTNNSLGQDVPGLRLSATFDPDFADEYAAYVSATDEVKTVPIEYYRVDWYDFARRAVNPRAVKVVASLIDASRIRLLSGADYYLQKIIADSLDPKERAQLARSFRSQQEQFGDDPAIVALNTSLDASQDKITDKRLTMEIGASQTNHWESALSPHLDRLPFHFSGGGEQNKLKILLALARKADDAHVILIEEPENHLSFSSLNQLVEKIDEKCKDRQVIISTHSSYVVNKLGLDQLMLLSGEKATRLSELPPDTQDYFKKLSGYDTLRLVLAKSVILVEGPSDELVVQRAYYDKHRKRPIENGVDVINVRGLSAKRFLDVAVQLKRRAIVVTDNDGDFATKVDMKYADYAKHLFIKICRSEQDSLPTLEPQIVAANSVEALNTILGTSYEDVDKLVEHMVDNKTSCALKLHDTTEALTMPQYIQDAIDGTPE